MRFSPAKTWVLEQQWSLPDPLPSASPEQPWVRTHCLAGSPELMMFPCALDASPHGIASYQLENLGDAHTSPPPDMVLVQNRLWQQNMWWGRAGNTWQGYGYGASLPRSSCTVPAAPGCSGSAWSLAPCSTPNTPLCQCFTQLSFDTACAGAEVRNEK